VARVAAIPVTGTDEGKHGGVMVAAGQNVKRLLQARGWGRRPWPGGAAGTLPVALVLD